MRIVNYNYNKTEVTAVLRQDNYLWIAFAQDEGVCTLYKVSAFNPYQIFFDISVPVDKIVRMKTYGNNLYLIVEDDEHIAVYYDVYNPLTDYHYIDAPTGIMESPVDLAIDDTYLYLLTPGEITGTTAQIIMYQTVDFDFVKIVDIIETP